MPILSALGRRRLSGYAGQGHIPPSVKNACCPLNMGGRAGEPAAPVIKELRSPMLIDVVAACGGSWRFQRAISESMVPSGDMPPPGPPAPQSSRGWLNLLKAEWASTGRLDPLRAGLRKLPMSAMFRVLLDARSVGQPLLPQGSWSLTVVGAF